MVGVGVKMSKALVMIMAVALSLGLCRHCAAARVHHVVGGDRGWDLTSDVASWSAGRVFRVGDDIWLAYSAAKESIAELQSKEEYESCDVSNPIRTFADGLDVVPLDRVGMRYFVNSINDNCKNGLRLHVEVMPHHAQTLSSEEALPFPFAVPPAPTTPSYSARFGANFILVFAGAGLAYMGV